MTTMRRVVVHPDRIAVEAARDDRSAPAAARRRCRVLTGLDVLRDVLPSALVALDFDGTLAPISPHPDDARRFPAPTRCCSTSARPGRAWPS